MGETSTRSHCATILAMVAAVFGGATATFIAWFLLKHTSLPAFGPSMVSRAFSTLCIGIIVALTAGLLWWRVSDQERNRQTPRWREVLTRVIAYLSPAGLVVAVLGIPLSATKLYLDGISVDQGFRTQYMTRLTDTWHLSDMNYIDLPAYYPAGWFWFGGRLANILHMPGWEVFQPWALVSMSAAACLLVPVWQRLTGSLPLATGIALMSTSIMLMLSAEEPYAGIVALGIPAAAVIAHRALSGARFALVGLTVYLGLSASTYTLYTGVLASAVVVLALYFALFVDKSWKPVLRLLITGLGSMAIAAIVWGPYVWDVLTGGKTSGSTAQHYLPIDGTQLPIPFFAFSFIGLICLIGLIFLIVRAKNLDDRSMLIFTVVVYGWVLASMGITLLGTTLLGFRLDILITLILATAGALGIQALRVNGLTSLYPALMSLRARSITNALLSVIVVFAGLSYAQEIPNRNAHPIDLAYTETDGSGERADRYPADAAQYYAQLDQTIRDAGYIPGETVVLTSEKNFMSYYPYRGFQALTSHYANPLGEFDQRNELIEQWATGTWDDLKDPAQFIAALDQSPWPAPEVFIFRSVDDETEGWNFDLAEDIYPNNPNVRFRGVKFNPASFDSSEFTTKEVGPFIIIMRNNHS